jgi:hypothetical protein
MTKQQITVWIPDHMLLCDPMAPIGSVGQGVLGIPARDGETVGEALVRAFAIRLSEISGYDTSCYTE